MDCDGLLVLYGVAVNPVESFVDYGVIVGKAHVMQRDQRVYPRRLNSCPTAVGFLMAQDPVKHLAFSQFTERMYRQPLIKACQLI